MTTREIVESALLGLAALVVLICGIGLMRARNVYARLHFLGPITVLVPTLVTIAILVERGFSQQGNKALMVGFALLVYSPVLTHAIARAAFVRERPTIREEGP